MVTQKLGEYCSPQLIVREFLAADVVRTSTTEVVDITQFDMVQDDITWEGV